MHQKAQRNSRNRTLLIIGFVFVLTAAFGIALSNYSVELGLSRASPGTVRAVAITAEVASSLDDQEDFLVFSEVLSTALVAKRKFAVNNPADGRVQADLGRALDCYSALRQAWQTDLEGAWDPDVHGDPAYWRLSHRAVELDSAGPLSPAEVRQALQSEAQAHLDRAFEVVER